MAQVGQIVLYGTEGACRVTEICKMKVGHKREEYYVLRPVHREGATVFVPLNNELLLSKMRPLLSREEIDALIDKVGVEEPLWIEDAAERKAEFQRILLGSEREELLRMIRALYQRRSRLRERGKHLRGSDEQMLRDAEKLLNDEFALVLEIKEREVPEYIRSRVEKSPETDT